MRTKLACYSILFIVFAYMLYGSSNTLLGSWKSENNFATVAEMFQECKELTPNRSNKKVVLRIDDIQAHYAADVRQMMLEEAARRQMKTLLAVIPYNLSEDRQLITYLKKHSCHFEMAMHGWDNGLEKQNWDTPEFGDLHYVEAQRRIRLGKDSLKRNLDVVSTTFVPPNNEYSSATGQVLKDEGFTLISAEGEKPFDYDTSTYDFVKEELIPAERVLYECEVAIEAKSYCIIMMHPQDYRTNGKMDSKKYEEYIKLLDGLQNYGVETVTLSELAGDLPSSQ